MFSQDSKQVQACRLIDFQLSRADNTAIDLATLLLACTDKPLRDAHWDELLRGYHSELQDTLKAAGISNPDTIYSWDQFMVR
ncbi:putative nicotinate-nucleotide adenylyltransferase [Frankliniella fusca]|uniref:Nicotinate-nucleotide adenylyltransferase n=1 Tax=Frankliniella fusca TaxID=407009 RepID=A0AAE1LNJ4_9NEOP|nr:putative nicotinate-nucleotide adenylyltransferase [Frankliniella fusca]